MSEWVENLRWIVEHSEDPKARAAATKKLLDLEGVRLPEDPPVYSARRVVSDDSSGAFPIILLAILLIVVGLIVLLAFFPVIGVSVIIMLILIVYALHRICKSG